MMPSRGVQLVRGTAPRMYQLQCRQLSSASHRITRMPLRNATTPPLRSTTQWQRSIPTISAAVLSIRHASTTPQEAPALANPPPAGDLSNSAPTTSTSTLTPDTSQSFPNLDTITLNDIDLDPIAQIPEKIGYLHEIGLNYGWGITSTLQWTIEHLHIVGGLPWWGSIAVTAALVRLVLFPLFLKSSDTMARQQAMSSVLKPINKKMRDLQKAGDTEGAARASQEYMAVRRAAGIRIRDQFMPILAQGMIAFCGFRLIRAMAALPVPALKTEGPLWLSNLTLSDPYLILPLLMAGTLHMLVRMGGESGAAATDQMSPGVQKFMLYGIPVVIVAAMGAQSAALCIWFAAGGALGVSQSLLLRQEGVRRAFGLTQLYKPGVEENDGDAGGGGMMDALNPFARGGGDGAVDVGRGGGRAAASAAAGVRRSAGGGAGKNAEFMNLRYQSPNLRRAPAASSSTGNVVDVQGVVKPASSSTTTRVSSTTEEMIQPNAPPSSSAAATPKKEGKGNIFQQAAASWKNLKESTAEKKMEKDRQNRAKRWRKEAEAYEKRAQERKGKK